MPARMALAAAALALAGCAPPDLPAARAPVAGPYPALVPIGPLLAAAAEPPAADPAAAAAAQEARAAALRARAARLQASAP